MPFPSTSVAMPSWAHTVLHRLVDECDNASLEWFSNVFIFASEDEPMMDQQKEPVVILDLTDEKREEILAKEAEKRQIRAEKLKKLGF